MAPYDPAPCPAKRRSAAVKAVQAPLGFALVARLSRLPGLLPQALALLSRTDLATRITDRIISLERLVPDGLEPLALHEVLGKVLVQIQEAPYSVINW